MPERHPPWAAWAGLLACALALRLHGLGRSLWYDELVTLQSFATSGWAALTQQVGANNHPAASLLAWFTPGSSELALRLPFALLGALAPPALAWSLWRWGWGRAGFLAGVALAVSPPAVLLSQQVRGYAGLLLCAALLPGLARGAPWRGGLVAALGLGFHLSFALAAAGWAGLRPRAARAWALGLGLGAAVWGTAWLRAWPYARRALRAGDPGAGHRLGSRDLGVWLSGGSWVFGVAFLAALAWGLTRLRRRERWLAGPLLGVLLLLALGAPGYPRFAAFALPCACALVGRGLATLPWPRLGAGLLVLLAVAPLGAQAQRELQDLRGAAALVRAEGATPYTAGFATETVRHYLPRVEEGGDAFLTARGPAAFVDPFPELSPPALRDALARDTRVSRIVLPGVHPVVVYLRR
ncbi:MAG: hypothetical protein R3F62_00090 [Planctomycetota bacterium]